MTGQPERAAEPSAAMLDSQSVKSSAVAGERGFDGAKLVTGCKRHLLVDVPGLLLVVLVHKASVSEWAGAKDKGFKRLALIWADGGYSGQAMMAWIFGLAGWLFEIVKRNDEVKGFAVLPPTSSGAAPGNRGRG